MRPISRLLLCLCLCSLLTVSVCAAPIANSWFIPELEQLQSAGLLPSNMQEADLRQEVTRLEICQMLMSIWTGSGCIVPTLPEVSPFNDTEDESVLLCYSLGFISGYGDGCFSPDNALTRQQIFCILSAMLQYSGIDTTVDMSALSSCIDGWSADEWALAPTALMLELGIATGSEGYLYPQSVLTREQALAMLWRTWQLIAAQTSGGIVGDTATAPGVFTGVSDAPQSPTTPDTEVPPASALPEESDSSVAVSDFNGLCSPNESGEDRYIRIFGSADAPKYQSAQEAEEHMVTITVPVWNFNTEHIKVETSRTLQVHEAIADTIMAIFVEIFHGPERFPIYAVSGYSWRGDGTSEHNWGIAVDINPDENYYVYHGVPTVGSHWTPGEDPYSIPADGDVVNAFAKYGFAWGGNAWRNSQDYMHFSYFGG